MIENNNKGVSKTLNGKWKAQIQSKGVKQNLGTYSSEEKAKEVYDKEYNKILKELEKESINLQRKNYPNWIITDLPGMWIVENISSGYCKISMRS